MPSSKFDTCSLLPMQMHARNYRHKSKHIKTTPGSDFQNNILCTSNVKAGASWRNLSNAIGTVTCTAGPRADVVPRVHLSIGPSAKHRQQRAANHRILTPSADFFLLLSKRPYMARLYLLPLDCKASWLDEPLGESDKGQFRVLVFPDPNGKWPGKKLSAPR